MDFGSLLHQAQRNERNAKKEPVNYYRTTFDPPKKESKSSKSLSANIQKFLERREREERRKEVEAKKKRDELLALRSQDGKAKKRVAAMLKRTKAANKAVIADAVDDDNTAVTLGGPAQCDEDDYGYVSQEATAFYAKLMDKYQSAPPDEPLFPQEKKAVVHDLKSTKDRVKMALLREEEEEMMPRKRKRKHKEKPEDTDSNQCYTSSDMRDLVASQDKLEERRPPPPKPKKAAPPPMDFNELLKIAQKKQFEPVTKVEPKVTAEEPERPMTKKQREEYLKEMEYRKRKEERDLARQNALKERARGREDRLVQVTETEERPPGKGPRMSDGDDRLGDSGEVKPVPSNRIPKLSDRYRTDSPQQRIPRLGDSSRPAFSQDRDSGTVGQKSQASQMRIPKVSSNNGGGQDVNLSSQQKLPKPNSFSSNNEERRTKPNFCKDDPNRNRIAKDDERRSARPEDQYRMKMKVNNDKDSYQRSVGEGQGIRQASVSRDYEQRGRDLDDKLNKLRTASKMNGNNSSMSGNLPKQLNSVKMMKDKTENKVRPSGGTSPLERKEVDGLRGKAGDQRRPSVNGVRPADFGKKLQESLQNKFQQRRDDVNRKPDNFARGQNPNMVKDLKTPSKLNDGGLKNSQARDLERRNGASKPSVNDGDRPGGSSDGQDRNSLQQSRVRRPLGPGSEGSERPRNPVVGGDGRPKQLPPDDLRPKKFPPQDGRPRQFPPQDGRPRQFPPQDGRPRQFPPQDGRPRQFPPQDGRPRQFPPQDGRPRQFPPPDVRKAARPFPPPDVRKKQRPPQMSKRRIIDSEDEYDSELDDFIDDGPDETEDYSKHIKEIFGYDKSRYSNVEDDEDECMESNFGQVLREEFVSTKMGILEDLEDIQKEQEEKRRKAVMKKRKLK